MDKWQTFAAYVEPSVRATIVETEIGGRRETAACAYLHPKPHTDSIRSFSVAVQSESGVGGRLPEEAVLRDVEAEGKLAREHVGLV
jgi:hypothetical protein